MDIHIEHVSKKFKENQLFEDVNLTLSDGRIYGFIAGMDPVNLFYLK